MHAKVLRFIAVGLVILASACKRPAPLNAPPQVMPQPVSSPRTGSPAPIAGPSLLRSGKAAPASKPATELVADYRSENDAEKRREIIADLLGAPPAEGVAAIGQMLNLEKRAELRVALFDALDAFDGQVTAKLDLLRNELVEHASIGGSREAALDALLNIQDRAAISLWRSLLQDPDEALQDVARQALAAFDDL
jgi:hypothetical protein